MLMERPSEKHETQVMEYRRIFIEQGEDMAGTSYLRNYEQYSEWLKFVTDNLDEKTKQSAITASVFLLVREEDGRVVGMMNLRHELNEYLEKFGGHVGYSVLPEERKKGYAKFMLEFAVKEGRRKGIEKLLLVCDEDNVASRKTIESCGGIFESSVETEDGMIRRYWISA